MTSCTHSPACAANLNQIVFQNTFEKSGRQRPISIATSWCVFLHLHRHGLPDSDSILLEGEDQSLKPLGRYMYEVLAT